MADEQYQTLSASEYSNKGLEKKHPPSYRVNNINNSNGDAINSSIFLLSIIVYRPHLRYFYIHYVYSSLHICKSLPEGNETELQKLRISYGDGACKWRS